MKPLDWISKNLFLKLLSLAFAILLWFFVVLEDKVEQALFVELKVRHIPKKLILVKPPPPTLTVYVTGPRSILRNIRQPLVLKIDLEDYKAGKHTISFSARDIDLPAGLKVLKIEPREIEIVLEREIEKTVPVEPGIYGSPPPGWKIAKIEVIPSRIKVLGPRSVLNRLKRVRTKPVDINGLTGFVTRKVPLDLPEHVRVRGSALVEVRIHIVEHIVTREFKELPLMVKGTDYKVEIDPSKINTILQGPERLLGPFSETKVEAFVDAHNLKPGLYQLPVKLSLPPGIKLLRLEPKKVKVKILPK